MYENVLHQQRYDYLIETLGSLEKQAEKQTLTAEQIQTTCDLDFQLSLLPYVAADTTRKFQQLEIHRRDGAWIRADRRTNSPDLRTAGQCKRLGGCCAFDCGWCHKVRSVSFIGGSSSHCTSGCRCCIRREGKSIGSQHGGEKGMGEIFYSGDVACRIGTRAANGRKRLAPVNDRIGVAESRHHQRSGESKPAGFLKRSLVKKECKDMGPSSSGAVRPPCQPVDNGSSFCSIHPLGARSMALYIQPKLCLDVAVDHRIRLLFKPVCNDLTEPSNHVSRIKARGRSLERPHSEIQVTAQLAGPAFKGGIAVALQQPRHNHPFEEGLDAVIRDCETLYALDDVFPLYPAGPSIFGPTLLSSTYCPTCLNL